MFNFINQNFTFPHVEKLFNDFSITYFAIMKKILFSVSILIISASIKAQTQVTHFSGGAFLGFNASQIDGDDMAGYVQVRKYGYQNDEENIKKLREEIAQWIYTISLGEKYHVPF